MKDKIVKVEIVKKSKKGWIEKNLPILLPAVLTCIGLLFIGAEYKISKNSIEYERAKDFGNKFEGSINRLTVFISHYPPSVGEAFEWARIGLSEKEKLAHLKSEFNHVLKTYGTPTLIARFNDLVGKNPNPFSKNQPNKAEFHAQIQFYRTKFFDIAESPLARADILAVKQISKCIRKGACERETMCINIYPITLSYNLFKERLNEEVIEYRRTTKHPIQGEFILALDKATSLCPV